MRKLFLLSIVIILVILLILVKIAKAQETIFHLCNHKSGKEMPEVTWNKIPDKAVQKSQALNWTTIEC